MELKTKLKTPLIVVNFKTYKESTAANAEKLAKICEKVSNSKGIQIAAAVQVADIYRVSLKTKIPVLSEHMDYGGEGAFTGSVTAEDIKFNGASGTLINHSEDRMPMGEIKRTIERARENGLASVVCAETADEAEVIAGYGPDFIAIEPPELIGGDISVSTANPELIKDTVMRVKKIADIPVLCGAGVKTGHDVKVAHKLGADGILVASGVTKAKNPEEILNEFCEGLK